MLIYVDSADFILIYVDSVLICVDFMLVRFYVDLC